MALQSQNSDIIRHGEAVGIGMLCEIYFYEGKSKKFRDVKNLLDFYNLPVNLKNFKIDKNKNKVKKQIFNNIFLDKKKIGKYPRIIRIKKIGTPKITEMKNNLKIRKTINEVLFN